MKKIIKSDKFTYSWMVICNTAFSWTVQIKNESLKTVVICNVVLLSALLFAWITKHSHKTDDTYRKRKRSIPANLKNENKRITSTVIKNRKKVKGELKYDK
jgi:hypothetical protein